jgi:hypothetical protein
MLQIRVPLGQVADKLQALLCKALKFEEAGTMVGPAKEE